MPVLVVPENTAVAKLCSSHRLVCRNTPLLSSRAAGFGFGMHMAMDTWYVVMRKQQAKRVAVLAQVPAPPVGTAVVTVDSRSDDTREAVRQCIYGGRCA